MTRHAAKRPKTPNVRNISNLFERERSFAISSSCRMVCSIWWIYKAGIAQRHGAVHSQGIYQGSALASYRRRLAAHELSQHRQCGEFSRNSIPYPSVPGPIEVCCQCLQRQDRVLVSSPKLCVSLPKFDSQAVEMSKLCSLCDLLASLVDNFDNIL